MVGIGTVTDTETGSPRSRASEGRKRRSVEKGRRVGGSERWNKVLPGRCRKEMGSRNFYFF